MPIEERTATGRAVVGISGRLTLGPETEQLETLVNSLLKQGRKHVVLDMTALDYVDSSGIGAVIACVSSVKKSGGELRVAGLNARLRRIFKMTGVDRILSIYPTLADASGRS